MRKYAADNLMFLREQYPDIYKTVSNQCYNKERYRIVHSRNNQVNLIMIDDSGNEHYLYSRYNPEREVEKWLESVEERIATANNLLLYGFGFGYHLETILQRYPEKNLFIYEPDPDILYAAIECCDLRPLLDRDQIKVFAVGHDPIIQTQMLELTFGMVNGSLISLIIPAYEKIQHSALREFRSKVDNTVLMVQANLNTFSKFQLNWAENTILNIANNLNSYFFAPMKGAAENIPAIIVGSGPSLGMEIGTLRKLKNHACIIAAGSSIQALMKHGIEPDLLVSMDPGIPNYRVFQNINIHDIPFLYVPTIHHAILDRELPYLMHTYFTNDVITRYLMGLSEEDMFFLSTATVTGTAIQAAIFLGCSQIVFIGQDFSYPNNQYYTDGVNHIQKNSLEKTIKEADQYIENVQGEYNRTTLNMQVLKESTEIIMGLFHYSEYYNASQVGAKIKYTKPKSLEQLYEECKACILQKNWFKEQMKNRLRKYSPEKYEQVIHRIQETNNRLPDFLEKIDRLAQHMEQVTIGELEQRENISWLKIFDEMWNDITKSEMFENIFSFPIQKEINNIMRLSPEIQAENDHNIRIRKIVQIVEPALNGIKRVAPVVQKNMQQLLNQLDSPIES